MRIKQLTAALEAFDADQEIAISVAFPNIDDWTVLSYDVKLVAEDNSGDPVLEMAVYLADFDYPQIVAALKAAVAAIPDQTGHN